MLPTIKLERHKVISMLSIAFVIALVCLVYGQFLNNPIVFDDVYFFNGQVHPEFLGKIFDPSLRWLPYATFEWTRVIFGLDLIWFRMGNIALHVINIILLFVFLVKLYGAVLDTKVVADNRLQKTVPHWYIAFFGAAIFAVHPASVYAVAYLSQRSILMATLFMLTMLILFLHGLIKQQKRWLLLSAVAYFFAVLSKEHAIMAPALLIPMMYLLNCFTKQMWRRVLPVFVMYFLIALYVVWQVKGRHVIGAMYEVNALDMFARLNQQDSGFDKSLAYPLSVLTQAFLFFKYLLVWCVPSIAWMSVDMYEPFAMRLWAWPHIFGALCFVVYPIVAVYLLRQKDKKGLLGFAMLFPWILFMTEFSTIRIQETFVLYRTYLWMTGIFIALPLIFQYTSYKRMAAILSLIMLILLGITWERLGSFSHGVILWDDAARLLVGKDNRPGVERVYRNRGASFARMGFQDNAIADYNKALAVYPKYTYVYTDRGLSYFHLKKYQLAIDDFSKAITDDPSLVRAYVLRGDVYVVLKDKKAAQHDYAVACARGVSAGCEKLTEITPSGEVVSITLSNK